jgi:hypothetical protein
MKGIFKLTLLSASLFASTGAFAVNGFVDVGGAKQESTIDALPGASISSRAIILEAGIQFNEYFAVSIWGGTAADKEVVNTQLDNYVNLVDGAYSDVITDKYESTFEMGSQYGANVTLFLPVAEHFKVFTQLGYAYYQAEIVAYMPFNDSLPSLDPAGSFEGGSSECAITGLESKCGGVIDSLSGSLSTSAATGSLGAEWNISKSVALVGVYTKTLNSEIDVNSASLRLRFRF